jgi:hypothetical protein
MLEASNAQRYLDLNVREGQVTERIAHESLKLADGQGQRGRTERPVPLVHPHPARRRQPAMREACLVLMRTFGLQGLIVTLGERGAMHFGADGTVTANHECHAPERSSIPSARAMPSPPCSCSAKRKAGRWRLRWRAPTPLPAPFAASPARCRPISASTRRGSKLGSRVMKARLSFWQIVNMNIGFFGIQFSFGLQQSSMSPIYKYLGADEASLPYLWLAGPMTGLLVQPLIGAMSDRTITRWGRRTPYF